MRSRNDSSSERPSWLGLFGLAVVLLWDVASHSDETNPKGAAPETFAALLAEFESMTGLEARFEEEKFLAMLAAPLRSSGRLYFWPPSTLLRRVEAPSPQEILVTEDRVRISDGKKVQSIDLAARSEVRPLVESMIWIFTGNRESLERVYEVDYQSAVGGRAASWQVRLIPKQGPLSQLVSELRVAGSGPVADTLELLETSGDRTHTRIFDVDPRRRFDPAERRALFGESAP